MNNIFNNEDFILYQKTPKKIVSYMVILYAFLFAILIIGNIKYKTYKSYKAIYYNGNLYFKTDIIYDLKDMYYDNKKYEYDIVSINNDNDSYIVEINSSLSLKWLSNGNLIDIYFVYQETSVFKEVFKKIWKG